MRTCFPRKPPSNYPPPDHMTMPLNSRTCLCPNGPRLTHSIPSNIKPVKSSLKNISRQGKSPLQNPLKLHHSFLLKRKKLGNYTPAKTTSISIATPSRMPTPSPSSLTLLTNCEGHQSSPNLMYVGDTTMSSSNWRTNRRQPLPPC